MQEELENDCPVPDHVAFERIDILVPCIPELLSSLSGRSRCRSSTQGAPSPPGVLHSRTVEDTNLSLRGSSRWSSRGSHGRSQSHSVHQTWRPDPCGFIPDITCLMIPSFLRCPFLQDDKDRIVVARPENLLGLGKRYPAGFEEILCRSFTVSLPAVF